MKSVKLLLISLIILTTCFAVISQVRSEKSNSAKLAPIAQEIRSSAAYAEVLLRKTELLSELEALLVIYKEGFPKVKELRYKLHELEKALSRISNVKAVNASKLTLALGKLLVRKVELSTEHWLLKSRFSNEHPKVKKAKRKLEIFENAIKEIL